MSRRPAPPAVQDAVWTALLGPPGTVPAIGAEETLPERTTDAGVRVVATRSREGSTRYVAHLDGQAAAVLQVVSRDGAHARIANAYAVPAHRRRGLASALLALAREDFHTVVHSDDLSPDGTAFARATR